MPVHVLVSIWCTVKESEKKKEEKWYPVVGMSRKWGPETGRRRRRRRKERGKQNLALSEKWEKEKKQVPESDRSNERGKRTARRVIIKEGTREREKIVNTDKNIKSGTKIVVVVNCTIKENYLRVCEPRQGQGRGC